MPLPELAGRHPRLVLLALAVAVGLAFQGSRGLYESTEGRYAECGLEMVRSGSWLEPTLSGRPHWTKPPLAYWAVAAGVQLAGANGWGARLGNAAAFCATVLLVAGIGAALWDRRTGLVAGLVYLTSLFPAGAAAILSADTLLTCFELLAVYLWVRAWRDPDPRRSRWFVRGMWLAWGLAFMTKGPPGLLPLAALLIVGWRSRRRVPIADPLGLLLFAVVGLGWYALVALRHPGLLSYFVGDEIVGRVASNRFRRNPEWWIPFALYLPVLIAGQGPWLVTGVRLALGELRSPRAIWARARSGDAGGLLLLWLVLPLAVFFLASSRLTLYVLPLYAPVALALARTLTRTPTGDPLRRTLAVALPSVLAIVLLKAAAAWALPPSPKDMAALHGLVLREAGEAAEVRVYREDQLYGLQFYLGGALTRVTLEGSQPWADERTDEAIASLARPAPRARVVVARSRHADELATALGAAGVAHRRAAAPGRELFVVPAASTDRTASQSPGGAP